MSGAAAEAGIAALVLAAGAGRRFGQEPKLLAELRGKPLVRHVVEAALASRARPVIAVLGARADQVAGALDGLDVLAVRNPRWADGLSTSLQAGFAALPESAAAVVVLLGDMPLVTFGAVDVLIEAWLPRRPAAVVPVHEGRRGNPVLLSRALAPLVMRLEGDRGAGALLRGRPDVLELAMPSQSILADVDTPAALAALRGSAP